MPDLAIDCDDGTGRSDATSFDRAMMERALELAKEARNLGEVPVGAVVVRRPDHCPGIQFEGNTSRSDGPCRAAGPDLGRSVAPGRGDLMIACCMSPRAVRDVCRRDRSKPNCSIGLRCGRSQGGACASLYRLVSDPRFNHQARITAGVLGRECGEILIEFFQDRRAFRKLDQGLPEQPTEGCLSG